MPKHITNLKKLSHTAPTVADIESLEQELYRNPSDRASVILQGTLLESVLEGFLQFHSRADQLDSLFGQQGILGTFGAKITIAYAFKLIGPITMNDLDLVRRLRDAFAHARLPITFKTDEVAEACRHFQLVDLPSVHIPYRSHELTADEELAAATNKANPKTRFVTTCHTIAERMASSYRPQEGMLAWDAPLP